MTDAEEVDVVESLDGILDAVADPPQKIEKRRRRGPKYEENQSLFDAFDKMHEEYKKDCVVNYGNIGDVVMRVPAIKQKWVSRYCKYRRALIDAKRAHEDELEAEAKRISANSSVAMTQISALKAASKSNSQKIGMLAERVDLLTRMDGDLSEILKHVHFLNTEIATIVDFMKMENS